MTLKPVYIFRRYIASCTVITMLTALSASARILDPQRRPHRKHTSQKHYVEKQCRSKMARWVYFNGGTLDFFLFFFYEGFRL